MRIFVLPRNRCSDGRMRIVPPAVRAVMAQRAVPTTVPSFNGLLRTPSLFAVSLLAFAGCSTTHPGAAAKDDSETVMVTYRVQSGKEAEFEALLADAWKVYRAEGLVYSEPHLIVRDADGEGKTRYVEIFTWGKSPDHPPATVLAVWKQEQALCESRDGHRGIEGGEVNLVTGK